MADASQRFLHLREDGYFSFYTPPGTYQLGVTKSDYQSYRSPDLVVVDKPVRFDVPFTPLITEDAAYQIEMTDNGFAPSVLTVQVGDVVEWVNVGDSLHSTSSISPTVAYVENGAQAAGLSGSGGWDSGLVNTGSAYRWEFAKVGAYEYEDVAEPSFTATVIVISGPVPQPPSTDAYLPRVSKEP